jgi:hypothetical protein
MINALDAQAVSGKMSWMPISFYESYSSVLPQDNDQEVLDAGLSPTIFSDIEAKMPEAIASVHDIDPKVISKIGYHTQKWEPGAYARVHSDNTDEHGNSGAFTRSRYAGFLYLNDNFEGGATQFPKINKKFKPKKYSGILFYPMNKNGDKCHENSLHAGMPITKGQKYIANVWIRDKKYREANLDKIHAFKNKKTDCPCGGSYTHCHKALHLRILKHQNYIKSLNDIEIPNES